VVTGTYRSGTTFVERLVDNLSDGYCASQPFPYLYLAVKREFLEATDRPVPEYPIGTGFHDASHQPDELAAFCRSHIVDRAAIDDAFTSMQGYSGAKTPELADVVHEIPAGTLAEVVCSMHARLAHARMSSATLLASKEALLEEFIPAFVEAGIRVLLVVRDPRAVVASTIGPASGAWTGRPRPLLHSIRLWRKSVAYALRYTESITFARLEDFASDPAATLVRSLHALGVDTEGHLQQPWLDAGGQAWHPNTSFPADTTTPPAPPTFHLSPRQIAYVEALARPEMLALGYEPVSESVSVDDALTGLQATDDPGRDHPAFAANLSVNSEELQLERQRLEYLVGPDRCSNEASWFVLPGVRDLLVAATAEHPINAKTTHRSADS
jgi:hypothetical protein